jgi:hypothetical protein
MVTPAGVVKVLDFGLAAVAPPLGETPKITRARGLAGDQYGLLRTNTPNPRLL